MKIILDVMGGDNAPEAIIMGAYEAIAEYDVRIALVGEEQTIMNVIAQKGLQDDNNKIEIVNAPQSISMEDAPLSVVRDKRESSMAIGLHMLHANEGDAFVSAGNTGALHTGSTLIVRRIKGIKKSAIGTVLPFDVPVLLLDSGANLDVTPEVFQQFAYMGTAYMRKIFGIERPRVGLLNIGVESTKGNVLHTASYELLSADECIDFVGNIEAREIPNGLCDILITDGFTGNIVLKYTEGLLKYTLGKIKQVCTKNLFTKTSAMALQGGMKRLKKEFDPSEYGGAPLLGLTKPVIKAHGSSDSNAIKHAIKQAMFCASTGISFDIAKAVKAIDTDAEENAVANSLDEKSN